MDELAGRRLAQSITAEQTRAPRGIVERMEQAARADDADAHHLLNLEFHEQRMLRNAPRAAAVRARGGGEGS